MAYTLSPTELDEFTELAAIVAGALDPQDSDHWSNATSAWVGQYYRAYDYLYSVQTVFSAGVPGPKANVDSSVWLWLQGASQVNSGTGAFSTFIRSYSAEQYKLRTGEEPPAGFLQDASDNIALEVIEGVLTNGGQVPTITQIGSLDAGTTIGELYGDQTDFSAWSGVPLFLFLGVPTYFTQHILDVKNGTYDFLALVKSGLVALGNTSSNSFLDLSNAFFETIRATTANSAGFPATASSLAAQLENGLAFFKAHFAGSSLVGSSFLLGEIQLGNLTEADNIDGDSEANFIHAGGGDDTVTGSTDSDYLDGGDGVDTLNYADLGTPLKLKFEAATGGNLTATVDKGSQGVDRVTGFEKLTLSTGADTVKVSHTANLTSLIEVDAGASPAGKDDTLDLSALGQGYTLTGGVLTGDGVSVNFKNFETLIGLATDDTFILANSQFRTVHPGRGNDTVTGSSVPSNLFGDEGDDVLNAGSSGDFLDGGVSDGAGDVYNGGAGADKFIIGNGAYVNQGIDAFIEINNADASDRLVLRLANCVGAGVPDALTKGIVLSGGVAVDEVNSPDFLVACFTNTIVKPVINSGGDGAAVTGYTIENTRPELGNFAVVYQWDKITNDLWVSINSAYGDFNVHVANYQAGQLGLNFTSVEAPLNNEFTGSGSAGIVQASWDAYHSAIQSGVQGAQVISIPSPGEAVAGSAAPWTPTVPVVGEGGNDMYPFLYFWPLTEGDLFGEHFDPTEGFGAGDPNPSNPQLISAPYQGVEVESFDAPVDPIVAMIAEQAHASLLVDDLRAA